MSGEPETGDVRLKNDTMKRFCEKVGGVNNTRSMIYEEKFGFNVRAYEMIANIDVLGLRMIVIVCGELQCSLIVAIQWCQCKKSWEKLAYEFA